MSTGMVSLQSPREGYPPQHRDATRSAIPAPRPSKPKRTHLGAPGYFFLRQQCRVDRGFAECWVYRDVATATEGRAIVPRLLAVACPAVGEWQAHHGERQGAVWGAGMVQNARIEEVAVVDSGQVV